MAVSPVFIGANLRPESYIPAQSKPLGGAQAPAVIDSFVPQAAQDLGSTWKGFVPGANKLTAEKNVEMPHSKFTWETPKNHKLTAEKNFECPKLTPEQPKNNKFTLEKNYETPKLDLHQAEVGSARFF